MMKSQRIDTEKINLIKGGKKIGIDEIIKRNEGFEYKKSSHHVILMFKV